MPRRWCVIFILLLMVSPTSILYAVDMGGMGNMAAMVDKIPIQTKTVGEVVFSHRRHGANCNACHPKLFQKKRNSNHVSMKVMEQGKSCGACHNGRRAFSVKSNCSKCHAGDIEIRTAKVGNVLFSHDVHSDMFGCSECHPAPFRPKNNSNKASMKAMENGKSCGACHDGDSAFGVTGDCVTCHAGDVQIQTKAVGKVMFSHDKHGGMFGCDDCHPELFKPQKNSNHATMKAMADGKSCGACHDGDTAFGVGGDCATCHAGDILFKEEDAGNVNFPHTAHTDMFGCEDCHPDLFKPERGANKATMEEMENGKSCGACHDGSSAFGVAEDCESCHEM